MIFCFCQPLAIAALSRTLFMFSSFNNMLKFATVTTARAMKRRRSRRRKRRKPRRELNGDLVWAPCPSVSKLVGETSGDFSQLIILLGDCDPTDEKNNRSHCQYLITNRPSMNLMTSPFHLLEYLVSIVVFLYTYT